MSTDKGDMMLRFLLLRGCTLSVGDAFPWCQDGVVKLSLTVSVEDGLRPTTVVVGDTRLISTDSAEEILRSVQRGGETTLGLGLVLWQRSMSLISDIGIGSPLRLLVPSDEPSSGRRIRSLSESWAKEWRGGRVLLLRWLQRV